MRAHGPLAIDVGKLAGHLPQGSEKKMRCALPLRIGEWRGRTCRRRSHHAGMKADSYGSKPVRRLAEQLDLEPAIVVAREEVDHATFVWRHGRRVMSLCPSSIK